MDIKINDLKDNFDLKTIWTFYRRFTKALFDYQINETALH